MLAEFVTELGLIFGSGKSINCETESPGPGRSIPCISGGMMLGMDLPLLDIFSTERDGWLIFYYIFCRQSNCTVPRSFLAAGYIGLEPFHTSSRVLC